MRRSSRRTRQERARATSAREFEISSFATSVERRPRVEVAIHVLMSSMGKRRAGSARRSTKKSQGTLSSDGAVADERDGLTARDVRGAPTVANAATIRRTKKRRRERSSRPRRFAVSRSQRRSEIRRSAAALPAVRP
jgi:hypothetical protein